MHRFTVAEWRVIEALRFPHPDPITDITALIRREEDRLEDTIWLVQTIDPDNPDVETYIAIRQAYRDAIRAIRWCYEYHMDPITGETYE